MCKKTTIKDLQAAIASYETAVKHADILINPISYEKYLRSKQMQYGLCHYLENKRKVSYDDCKSWTKKYLQRWEMHICAPIEFTVNKTIPQMKFRIEVRLTTLKWELGLRLAEQELKALQNGEV